MKRIIFALFFVLSTAAFTSTEMPQEDLNKILATCSHSIFEGINKTFDAIEGFDSIYDEVARFETTIYERATPRLTSEDKKRQLQQLESLFNSYLPSSTYCDSADCHTLITDIPLLINPYIGWYDLTYRYYTYHIGNSIRMPDINDRFSSVYNKIKKSEELENLNLKLGRSIGGNIRTRDGEKIGDGWRYPVSLFALNNSMGQKGLYFNIHDLSEKEYRLKISGFPYLKANKIRQNDLYVTGIKLIYDKLDKDLLIIESRNNKNKLNKIVRFPKENVAAYVSCMQEHGIEASQNIINRIKSLFDKK